MNGIGATRRRFLLSSPIMVGCGRRLSAAQAPQVDVRVMTEQGSVIGALDREAVAWKGIPFAKPPVGDLGGRVPQDPAVRSSPYEATTYRSKAVQLGIGPGTDSSQVQGSEDCLYLNVWAPRIKQRGRLPVIVWIHGGGFQGGSGSEPAYAGDRYASDGNIVFVTINYRLNGFGFLYNPNEPGSANIGLLDQMKALRWVRRNIENFGGDAANVTVMSESAGAMSIGHLLGTPMAAGLFDKAILQSGGTSHVFSNGEHVQIAEMVLRAAGVAKNDYGALFRLNTAELVDAFAKVADQNRGTALVAQSPFYTAVDGVVLKQHPLYNIRPVTSMIAHCKVEMMTFARSGAAEPMPLGAKQQALCGAERWRLIQHAYDGPSRTGANSRIELYSDIFCGIASLRLADAITASGGKTWSYRFDYDAAAPFGAGHATDIAFTFYRGPGEAERNGMGRRVPWTAEARAVGETIWGMTVNFARSGKPHYASLPNWPQHDRRSIPFMSIKAKNELLHDFIGAARRVSWDPVKPEQMI